MIRDFFKEFQLMESAGEGAFGIVNKTRHHVSGKIFAVKRISGATKPGQNEADILPTLNHPNIIEFVDCFTPKDFLWIVIEYLPMNLSQVIGAAKDHFHESIIKSWILMLLSALKYLHNEAHVIHRDIKPSNLLIGVDGILKLADFGMCCRFDPANPDQELDHRVYTRWYRAPELLFGARVYGVYVDMWACGCVMGELYNLKPLFPGQSDIDQLCRVVNFLGTPSVTSWPGCEKLPDFGKITFPNITPMPMGDLVPDAQPAAVQFLRHLLCYHGRADATKAEKHVYFRMEPLPSSLPIAFRMPEIKQAASTSATDSVSF